MNPQYMIKILPHWCIFNNKKEEGKSKTTQKLKFCETLEKLSFYI